MKLFKKSSGEKTEMDKDNTVGGKQEQTEKCSKCGRQLEPIGSIFDYFEGGVIFGQGAKTALQQWLGHVCMNCQMIFCTECEPLPSNLFTTRCSNCGEKALKPAVAKYLRQLGKLQTRG